MALVITPINLDYSVPSIISKASHIIKKENEPAYTIEMFLEDYPQFGNTSNPPCDVIPDSILLGNIAIANSIVLQVTYGQWWRLCCGLVAAHLATLYLMGSQAVSGDTPAGILANAMARGIASSKSVEGVSISYDTSFIVNDLMKNWGTWNLTTFGQQFVTYARMFNKGGMYIW